MQDNERYRAGQEERARKRRRVPSEEPIEIEDDSEPVVVRPPVPTPTRGRRSGRNPAPRRSSPAPASGKQARRSDSQLRGEFGLDASAPFISHLGEALVPLNAPDFVSFLFHFFCL